MNELTKKHVPHRLCKEFRFQMTPELHELMTRKHYCWRQIFRYDATNRINEFIDLRKRVKKLSIKLNIESQNQLALKFKPNPKLFWNYVQKKTRSKDATSTISVNGIDLIGGKEKAQAFVDFLHQCILQIQVLKWHLFLIPQFLGSRWRRFRLT